MTIPRLNVKLTPRGCEIEAPEHGLTIVIGRPRKCPTLPPSAPAIDTAGELVADNVIPFARRVA